jgi:hypothetical protein
MSNVNRSPMTNHRSTTAHGVVRFVVQDGVGTGKPDVNRSAKGVMASDKGNFNDGKGVNRESVYSPNNSGKSHQGGGPRSVTK